ncbi:MAG: sodium:solute symporter [Bacteroidia bacterium]
MSISIYDLSIIIGYFLLIFGVAYWAMRRDRKSRESGQEATDYFLASRSSGWFVIGASLFASNIGSEHIVGLVGSGARGDMPAAQFEILAALILMLLGWLFVPFYLRSGVFTMPEFLERRYNGAARTYLSVVSILAYILTKISLTIFAGALVFEVIGVEFWTGALIVVIVTGVYTIFGGLKAVIYTDMVQLFILLIGTALVTILGFDAIGGWEGLQISLNNAAIKDPSIDPGRFFNLWRPGDDTDYPWTGMLFGAPILGVWYWCTDQFIVQRVLSAKDVSQARKGTIFAGFLKQLPILLFVFPGIIAFGLASQGLLEGFADDPDQALPRMITEILPVGLKGLVLAGLLAALMSSLSSVFNSCSTLITIDFYKKYHPDANQKKLVWAGQIATAVLVIVSLGWIPLMKTLTEGGGIFMYLQSVQAYISPPIAAAFLLGLFLPRINGRGAIWSLWIGFGLGLTRLVLEFLTKEGIMQVADDSLVAEIVGINFLHFALLLFGICAITMWSVSLTAPAPSMDKIGELVYKRSAKRASPGKRQDAILSFVLVVIVLLIWAIFSPWGLGA